MVPPEKGNQLYSQRSGKMGGPTLSTEGHRHSLLRDGALHEGQQEDGGGKRQEFDCVHWQRISLAGMQSGEGGCFILLGEDG